MAKQKTIRGLVDDCAVLMQKIVRLKDFNQNGYCTCVTCGKTGHWKEMQGGHYISRVYTSTKLLEENIHPQCRGCNMYGHRVHDDYTVYMIDTYGEDFVRELNEIKRNTKKYTRTEVTELREELKERLKELC